MAWISGVGLTPFGRLPGRSALGWQAAAAGSVTVTSQVSGPLVVVPAGVVDVTWSPAAWSASAIPRGVTQSPTWYTSQPGGARVHTGTALAWRPVTKMVSVSSRSRWPFR